MHFLATLSILEPTIVLVQGIRVWNRTLRSLPVTRTISEHLFECELPSGRALVAGFSHASARGASRWDAPSSEYLKNVVAPTLRRALAEHG